MEEELPNEFDVVVVGTGFSESIVAAAASRIGKSVLHIDPNDFYGGAWASFNLEALGKFINFSKENSVDESGNMQVLENSCKLKNPTETWYAPEKPEEETEENDWTKEKMMKEFRKFNIDLSPRVMFGKGKLIELLITSNICRYLEFRAVDKILTLRNGELKIVPCSRTDVFNTKELNVVEKRMLMKLLTKCVVYEDNEDSAELEGNTFLEYLKTTSLSDHVIHCVLYAISMSNDDTPRKEGFLRTKKFLESLGKYGNTPFLFPLYGCGDIPQCFCRLCAVFGGVYCLKRPVNDIVIEEVDGERKVTKIKCGGREISTKYLVLGHGNIPKGLIKDIPEPVKGEEHCGALARAAFITATPIGDKEMNSGNYGINILRLPGAESSQGAIFLQVAGFCGVGPRSLYLIHITTNSVTGNPETDLQPFVEQIFNKDDSPKVLYSAYFTIPKCMKCEMGLKEPLPKNLFTACGPFFEPGYDMTVTNAREIFDKMCPGEEFLPRAPDPEEVVFGDEDPVAVPGEEAVEDDVALEEQIKELEEGFENQLRCMAENTKNEENEVE